MENQARHLEGMFFIVWLGVRPGGEEGSKVRPICPEAWSWSGLSTSPIGYFKASLCLEGS